MNSQPILDGFEALDTRLNADLDVNLPQVLGSIALK